MTQAVITDAATPATSAESSAPQAPLSQKLAWGVGGAVDNIVSNGVGSLALPLYNISLGVNPVLIGYAVALPRIFDAIIDPFIGNLSDNTRSRFGRRRPFIFLGAILCAISFTVIWSPPTFLSKTGLFWYFLIAGFFYYLSYAIFIIPRGALGWELSTDYHERTRIMAINSIFAYAGGLLFPWLYKLAFNPIFGGGNEVIGIRKVAALMGVLILVCGLAPALFCRERGEVQAQPKVKLLPAFRMTLTNFPFLLIVSIVVLILVGIMVCSPMNVYINISYICGGDKEYGALLGGWAGTLQALTGAAAVPLVTWLARRFGKKTTLLLGQCLAMVGFLSSWVLFTPAHPYLQLVVTALVVPGLTCVWVLNGSILADVCDLDELRTGLRREGMFGAVFALVNKAVSALVMIVAGYVLIWSGYQDNVTVQSEDTLVSMRLLFALVPTACLVASTALTLLFPITEQTARQVRAELDARKPMPQ